MFVFPAVERPEVFVNFDDRKFNGICFNGKPEFEVIRSVIQGEGKYNFFVYNMLSCIQRNFPLQRNLHP